LHHYVSIVSVYETAITMTIISFIAIMFGDNTSSDHRGFGRRASRSFPLTPPAAPLCCFSQPEDFYGAAASGRVGFLRFDAGKLQTLHKVGHLSTSLSADQLMINSEECFPRMDASRDQIGHNNVQTRPDSVAFKITNVGLHTSGIAD